MRIGVTELIIILVIVIIIFGGKKIASLGKDLGKGIRDFKNEVKNSDDDTELEQQEPMRIPAEKMEIKSQQNAGVEN